jgi:hypothetical protein
MNYMWVVLLNQRGQLDLKRQKFGSGSSSGKQRMDKEKLVLSVLVSHGQNDEVQIEDEGCLEWKRKKRLDGRQQGQEMQGLGCSCVQQIPDAYIYIPSIWTLFPFWRPNGTLWVPTSSPSPRITKSPVIVLSQSCSMFDALGDDATYLLS